MCGFGVDLIVMAVFGLRNGVVVGDIFSRWDINYLYFIAYLIDLISYELGQLNNLLFIGSLHEICQSLVFAIQQWTHYH